MQQLSHLTIRSKNQLRSQQTQRFEAVTQPSCNVINSNARH